MVEPALGSSVLNALVKLFEVAVQRAYPQLPDAPVVISLSGNSKFGDYQCNSAMPIAQLLKAKGEYFSFNEKLNRRILLITCFHSVTIGLCR